MHRPLEQFEIRRFIPLHYNGWDLSFTNSSLYITAAALLTMLVLGLPFIRSRAIPGNWQAFAEILYGFIEDMVDSNIGHEGKRFYPFIFTMFFAVALMNLLGLLPYSFTATSHVVVTAALAGVVFIVITLAGLFKHGLHFFSLFLPSGTPWVLAPLMIVIEIFSYLSRPITLSVRLAANMIAGHILLKVLAGFIIMMGLAWGLIAPFPFLVLFTGFEIFVALLQAYIFAILTCAYVNGVLHLH